MEIVVHGVSPRRVKKIATEPVVGSLQSRLPANKETPPAGEGLGRAASGRRLSLICLQSRCLARVESGRLRFFWQSASMKGDSEKYSDERGPIVFQSAGGLADLRGDSRRRVMTDGNVLSVTQVRPKKSTSTRSFRKRGPQVLPTPKEKLENGTAVLSLPGKYHRRLRTTRVTQRLIVENRRREKVIQIFPNDI